MEGGLADHWSEIVYFTFFHLQLYVITDWLILLDSKKEL